MFPFAEPTMYINGPRHPTYVILFRPHYVDRSITTEYLTNGEKRCNDRLHLTIYIFETYSHSVSQDGVQW